MESLPDEEFHGKRCREYGEGHFNEASLKDRGYQCGPLPRGYDVEEGIDAQARGKGRGAKCSVIAATEQEKGGQQSG